MNQQLSFKLNLQKKLRQLRQFSLRAGVTVCPLSQFKKELRQGSRREDRGTHSTGAEVCRSSFVLTATSFVLQFVAVCRSSFFELRQRSRRVAGV